MINDEVGKYRKKKSNKSKSSHRSNHKHEYKKVIVEYGGWAEKCTICGRIKLNNTFCINKDFIKPQYKNYPYISKDMFYSKEEISEQYPNCEFITFNDIYDN